ncbi:MAG: MBL fold metallo-hydrolase [Candidatus Thorarchaeota archaeon]|nr:MBL fold metallo-hydrolase [Candidatus Thorarchaeota archaeon]
MLFSNMIILIFNPEIHILLLSPHSFTRLEMVNRKKLKIQRLGTRGSLFTFDEDYLTNVYIVFGPEHTFILDTHLGPDSMKYVLQEIEERTTEELPIVIFNSHADYDHYWGNCAFDNANIVGHELCKERIIAESEGDLIKHANEKKGEIVIVPPNITFQENLRFEKDGVIFFYTPGHKLDSASCYDEKDRVLFVGDNVESPLPYLNHPNFDQYIQTLESYLKFDSSLIIAGHDPPLKNTDLIQRNIDYLLNFKEWRIDLSSMETSELHRHIEHNLESIRDELMRSGQKKEVLRHLEEAKRYLI